MFPSSLSAFPPPPSLIHPPLSTIEIGILEGEEEVGKKRLVGKKRGRTTKEGSKKVRKTDVIEVGESDEEEMGRMKWEDFEVHQLIAI